jgi:glycerol kinase
MEYILAIDQGTHASRALLFSERGQRVAQHLVPLPLQRPQPDRVEQDAGEILDSVKTVVRKTLASLPATQRSAVRCCGLTTQRSTVLAWHPGGAALSPAINWQDTRGAGELGSLAAHADEIQRLSGLPLSAHYGATKLHDLHRLHGMDPTLRMGPLAAFLLDNLTDSHCFSIDHANAQRMQLMDIHTLGWSSQLCDWFAVPVNMLPACQPVVSDYGNLAEQDVPVTAVSGDQNAAWFGAGAPPPGTVLVNIGSGAFVLTAQTAPAAPAGLLSSIVYSDARRSEYVVEGTVNGAGNALDWLQKRYRIDTLYDQLGAWLDQVSSPPLFLNTVGGLGSPWWRQQPAPMFVDDAGQFSHAERTAAVAESILFLIQYNLEQITAQQPVQRLRVSGGLSNVDALCRKLANLTQCQVQRSDSSEATARGIAWLAAGRPQHWPTTGDGQLFEPQADSGLQARYRACIERLKYGIATDHV